MLNKSEMVEAIDEVVAEGLEAIDAIIAEEVDPIADIGSPEKVLGKKVEDWTPFDIELLGMVYGPGEDTPLAKVLMKRDHVEFENKFEELKELEKEV